jgi:hypothetical protein
MKDVFDHMSESSKHLVDLLSVATVLGTLADMLPSIAALFTIVWTAIRIYETDTVQSMLGKKE